MRTFSFGGGWQSTAALVLAARGDLGFTTFLFANVGDDSEDPATLAYVREYAAPFAASHGLALHELSRIRRDGTTETLYGRLTRDGSRSLPIPVRMSNGAPGTRSCTADFKIKVIGRWLKAHGASTASPATVGVGISLDEIHRSNTRRAEPYEHVVYPLLDLRDPPVRLPGHHPVRRAAHTPEICVLVSVCPRGDRNRNARLAWLRAAVPVCNAIAGIDLADSKQMVVVTDHESRVLARRTFRRRAWELGAALDWAAARAAAAGFRRDDRRGGTNRSSVAGGRPAGGRARDAVRVRAAADERVGPAGGGPDLGQDR